MRFVVVSLLFLGWAFYEASGGADFVPRGVRPPQPVAVSSAAPDPKPASAAPVIAPRNPRPAADLGLAARRASARADAAEQGEPAEQVARTRTSLSRGLTLDEGTGAAGGLTLTALGQGLAGMRAAEPEPEPATPAAVAPAPDIREVTGTRANLRDGPGTIYPVVARLALGQQVEVLGESGTGWLRLRVLPDQRIGWIAASLIGRPQR